MKSMLHKNLLKRLLVFTVLITSFSTTAQMFVHSPAIAIPDNNSTGIKDTISIFDSGTISDLNVPIRLTHPNIGDIFVSLESPNGTVVTLIDRPGFPATTNGCDTDGINVTLVDTASQAIENACPAVVGNYYSPQSPLSAFFGESITGDWILTVSDNSGVSPHLGNLITWKLVFNNDNSVPPVIYVNQNATGNNNGSSWADAYTELSDATKSAWGNQIWVAQGTYLAHESDRKKSFRLYDDVKLYGGFSGNESALAERNWHDNPTILSGDLLGNDNGIVSFAEPSRGDNTHVLIRVESEGVAVDGVTIRDAHANYGSSHLNRGAAIYKANHVDSLVVRNCIIEKNTAKQSSGIHADFHLPSTSGLIQSAIIDKCIFRQNVSGYATVFSFTAYQGTLNAVVTNCLITQNKSENNSASDCYGSSAGFFDTRNSSTLNAFLVNCTVVNNEENVDVTIPVASPIGVRRVSTSSTLNFVAANNIFHENEINSLNGVTATFGALNSSNCPTSRLLQNNIRPDYDVVGCPSTTTSNGELDTLGILLDANGKPMTGSVAINAGDTTGVSQYVADYDLGNTQRILDGTIDIGCYEHCSNSVDVTTSTYDYQNGFVSVEVTEGSSSATYQWLDCNNNNASITGATGNEFIVSQNGSYACVITDGCATDTTECVIIDYLSINEESGINVTLYPNPTTGILNIKNGFGSVRIMDLTGKVVLETAVTNDQIDVSNLLNGVYLLELTTEKGIATQRFIKE